MRLASSRAASWILRATLKRGHLIPLKLTAGECIVLARVPFPNWDVWRNLLMLDHPAKHRCGTVGGVPDEARGLETKPLFNSLNHRSGRFDLVRAVRGRRLNVHDDPRFQVDQTNGRVGEERRATRRSGSARGRIAQGDHLRGSRRPSGFGSVGTYWIALFKGLEILPHGATLSCGRPPVDGICSRHCA